MKTILFIIIILLSLNVLAQEKREDLYIMGKTAYEKNDFVNSAIYLYTFKEINIEYLTNINPDKLSNLNTIINFSKSKIFNIGTLKIENIIQESESKLGVECKVLPTEAFKDMKIDGKDFHIKGIQLELEKIKETHN